MGHPSCGRCAWPGWAACPGDGSRSPRPSRAPASAIPRSPVRPGCRPPGFRPAADRPLRPLPIGPLRRTVSSRRASVDRSLPGPQGRRSGRARRTSRTAARRSVEELGRRLPHLTLAPWFEADYVGSFFFRGLARLDVRPSGSSGAGGGPCRPQRVVETSRRSDSATTGPTYAARSASTYPSDQRRHGQADCHRWAAWQTRGRGSWPPKRSPGCANPKPPGSRGYKTYCDGRAVSFVAPLDRLAVREVSARYLSQDERFQIADLRHAGVSMRQIADQLGRVGRRGAVARASA